MDKLRKTIRELRSECASLSNMDTAIYFMGHMDKLLALLTEADEEQARRCLTCEHVDGLDKQLTALKAQVLKWAKRIENYPCTSMMSDQENLCFIESERVACEMREAAGGDA